MDIVADLPSDPRAAEPVQVSEGAFGHPAPGARSGAVRSPGERRSPDQQKGRQERPDIHPLPDF